jgi:hypothetical protein
MTAKRSFYLDFFQMSVNKGPSKYVPKDITWILVNGYELEWIFWVSELDFSDTKISITKALLYLFIYP